MGVSGRDRVVTRTWPALVEQLVDHYAAAIREVSRSGV
jgi:phosphatidylinositol alpha 1,6-mannosyltransferase